MSHPKLPCCNGLDGIERHKLQSLVDLDLNPDFTFFALRTSLRLSFFICQAGKLVPTS